jgi:hypothetical protein
VLQIRKQFAFSAAYQEGVATIATRPYSGIPTMTPR